MKKTSLKLYLAMLVLALCSLSCEESDSMEPMRAIITELSETELKPGDQITIVGDQSVDASGANFIWEITGNGSMIYKDEERELPTVISGVDLTSIALTVEANGSFSVSLRIEKNGNFSSISTNFNVSGPVEVSDVPNDFIFREISLGTDPDYRFTSDVLLGNASIENGKLIVIAMGENAQLTIDGVLNVHGSLIIEGINGEPWKGTLVTTNGVISGSGFVKIRNSGSGVIGTYPNSGLIIESSSFAPALTLEFENTTGYDIYVSEKVTYMEPFSVTFSSLTPIHAPIALWSSLPIIGSSPGRLVTFQGDVNTQLSFGGLARLPITTDVLIKGGFATNDPINLVSGGEQRTIYMAENTAFIAGGGLNATDIIFKGEGNATWQGIYLGLNGISLLSAVTIEGAGSNPISSNAITGLQEKTALYCTGNLSRFESCHINNSGGYGIYFSGFAALNPASANNGAYGSNSFSNLTTSAISVSQEYGGFFSSGNSFALPDNVGAIEVRQGVKTPLSQVKWKALPDDHFYTFTGFLNISNNLTLSEGVHFKFPENGGVYFSKKGHFQVQGTSTNPVVFEGIGSSWYGMKIGNDDASKATFTHLNIRGGGGGTFVGATANAGLILDSRSEIDISNTTIANSSGYGVVTELFATEVDWLDATKNNSFSNNTLGDHLNRNN